MLDEANNLHPNIKLVCQLGTTVSFLGVLLQNKNGLLVTSVYHKEAAEPYIVPFKSDHPRHVFNNIIDGVLMRAVRYSSKLSAFNAEQRSIKLMLLYNGSYPPRYIYNRFMKFITNNLRISSILPLFETENNFQFVRGYLINKTTVTEQQIASRIAKTIDSMNRDTANDPLVRIHVKRKSKSIHNLIIHYVHEARFTSYKKYIHKLWDQIFQGTIIFNTKLIVGNRNWPNTTRTLVRLCPHPKISNETSDAEKSTETNHLSIKRSPNHGTTTKCILHSTKIFNT